MKAAKPKSRTGRQVIPSTIDSSLLNALKELRKELAVQKKVPAYVIFSDVALADMCRKLPRTQDEFLHISGVGKVKLAQYGQLFLEVIQKYAFPDGND